MVVGTQGIYKTWHLPKELLINASPFFAAALNGSFAEAKSVEFPEDATDAFEFFVQWLYVGEITLAPIFQTLVQAWILGDKLECPIFKDRAMLGLMRTVLLTDINTDDVRTAFENSVSGSKLRKFFLDLVRYDAGDTLGDDTEDWMFLAKDCVEFGDDLMRATFEKSGKTEKHPCDQKALYLEVLVVEDNSA